MPALDDLKFGITIDNKQAIAALAETQAKMGGMSQNAAQAAGLVGRSFDSGIIRPSGSARNAVVGMSQALSDSGMFMVNFRMGMMSIGNNIDFVTQSLAQLKAETQTTGQTMGQALKGALSGPTGVLLGINALVLALQILPDLFAKAVKSAQDAAEGFYQASLRATRSFEGYGNMLEARALDLSQMSERRLKSELQVHSSILMEVDRKRKVEEDILATLKDQGKEKEDEYKQREANVSLLTKQYNDEFRFLKAIGDEQAKRRKAEEDSLGKINALQKSITDLTTARDKSNNAAFIASSNARIEKLKAELELLTKINRARNGNITPVTERGYIFDVREYEAERKRQREKQGQFSPLLFGKVENVDVGAKSGISSTENKDINQEISNTTEIGRAAIESLGQSVQSQIGGAFERAFGNANSFLQQFAKSFLSTMAELGSKKLLTSLIDLIPGASAFFGLLPHAEGTIITKPIVGVDGSGMGHLFGEDGPEAVIPLSKLGQYVPDAKAVSSLPRSSTQTVINKIYINADHDWTKFSKGMETYSRRESAVLFG